MLLTEIREQSISNIMADDYTSFVREPVYTGSFSFFLSVFHKLSIIKHISYT